MSVSITAAVVALCIVCRSVTDPYTGEQVEAPEITLVADSGKKARVVLFNIFAGKVGYKIAVHGGGGVYALKCSCQANIDDGLSSLMSCYSQMTSR